VSGKTAQDGGPRATSWAEVVRLRTLPAARSTRQGAAAPGQPTLRIQLLKNGLPLEAA